jgi:hypothetical protein
LRQPIATILDQLPRFAAVRQQQRNPADLHNDPRPHPPSSLAIQIGAEHQARRQRLAMEGGVVYVPD